jgi:hypothetical protein
MLRIHKNSFPQGIFIFYVDFLAESNLKMVGTVQLIKFRYLLIIAQHLLASSKIVWRYTDQGPVSIYCTYDRSISVKTSENQERALEGELWRIDNILWQIVLLTSQSPKLSLSEYKNRRKYFNFRSVIPDDDCKLVEM